MVLTVAMMLAPALVLMSTGKPVIWLPFASKYLKIGLLTTSFTSVPQFVGLAG